MPPSFSPDLFIDFHTHRARCEQQADVLEIISSHWGDGKTGELYTLGSHPWLTPEPLAEAPLKAIEAALLHDPRCIALGECGLDKFKGPAMNVQIAVLEQLLDIADRLERSVVIHCVRAYDPLLKIKKNFSRIPHWAIHGYARHDVLAQSLVKHGFYLSVAPESTSHAGLLEAVRRIPADRLFLETDSAPAQDIVSVYNFTAELCGIDLEYLKAIISENCKTFFQK